jgi:hypothetical protein
MCLILRRCPFPNGGDANDQTYRKVGAFYIACEEEHL